MYVRQLKLGPMDNFVYLLGAEGSPEVAVVDPAWDVDAIVRTAQGDGKKIVCAMASHSHLDHINGLPELLKHLDIPVYAHKDEIEFSSELRKLGSSLRSTEGGQDIPVGPLTLKILHTPGHTPGSQCIYTSNAVVSGDTIFITACGRCDLRGGNPEDMYRSISQVLMKLPDSTRLFPGHDYSDVPVAEMAEVKRVNPYFQLQDMKEFVSFRMRPRK